MHEVVVVVRSRLRKVVAPSRLPEVVVVVAAVAAARAML